MEFEAQLNKLGRLKVLTDAKCIAITLGMQDVFEYVRINNPTQNLPYHGNFHQFLVAVTAFQLYPLIEPKYARNIFAAALFHDFNHSGGKESDAENIERAVAGWKTAFGDDQRFNQTTVVGLIRATLYPWEGEPTLFQGILRDADILASMDMAGVLEPINGLPQELQHKLGKVLTPKEMMKGQRSFLWGITLNTTMGRLKWGALYPTALEVQEAYVNRPARMETADAGKEVAE